MVEETTKVTLELTIRAEGGNIPADLQNLVFSLLCYELSTEDMQLISVRESHRDMLLLNISDTPKLRELLTTPTVFDEVES